ncbi:potassium channel family protein [Mesoaciditoga sp.]
MDPLMLEAFKARVRKMIVSFLLVVTGIIVATSGYMIIEKWDFLTSLYMAMITFSTVGFGLPKEMTKPGYIFTIIMIMGGISIFVYAVSNFAAFFMDGDIKKYMELKKVNKMIESMKDHCVIVGGGKVGKYVALRLTNRKYPYVLVDSSQEIIENVRELINEKNFAYVIGDATNEDTLIKAGILRAKTLVLTLPDDSLNVYITLMAKSLNYKLKIISKASDVGAIKRLGYAGVDNIVSSTEMVGSRMALLVTNPGVSPMMDALYRATGMTLEIDEVFVDVQSSAAGKTLSELKIPQRVGLIVIAVQKDENVNFNPAGSTVVEKGMRLIVLGKKEQIEELKKILK